MIEKKSVSLQGERYVKHKRLAMKGLKFSILFISILFQAGVVWGQSMVSEVPEHKSDTTIVRYWKEGISVVYTHNSDDENWFLLVDSTVSQVQRIAVPPEMTVNDFRILHDSVYFGGHYVESSGNQRGMLALFDIQDFYTGAGSFNYMRMQPTPMPDCYLNLGYSTYAQNQVYDVVRLAVYDDVQTGPKIAYIAKNYIVGETIMRVGIGQASYPWNPWNNRLIYNKYAEEEYTDIITTQNYVVAVARNNVNAHLEMRIFPKSSFIPALIQFDNFPGAFYYYNKFGQGLADLKVDENVMATALEGDEFAVAYHYTDSPKDGLAVKTFGINTAGTASLLQSLTVPIIRQPGSKWKMRDARYSQSKQCIMVLNDCDGGTVGNMASIVYQFPLSDLAMGITSYYGRYLAGYDLHAMDPFGTARNRFVASGNTTGSGFLSLYWEYLYSETSCGLQDAISGIHTTTTLYETYMETNINNPNPDSYLEYFVVEEMVRDVICNQVP